MANGKIVIDTLLDDKGVKTGLAGIADMGRKSGNALNNAFGSIKNIAGVTLGIKAVTAAFNMMISSIDGGIARFDTMQRFPRMMQELGYSAQESQKSIDSLAKGIEGLPTTLDDVVATTQSLSLLTGDLTKSTDLTLALNNAFLMSGQSTADAKRGMTQFTQMLARGEPDLISYRTLMETMPIALSKVSESFGLAADNPYALYDAMQDGIITFDEFANKLIELNDGVGGFAEMALINSEGIANSWEIVRISFTRGIADMLTAVNDRMLAMGLGSIASNIAKLKGVVNSAFDVMIKGVHLFFDAIELIREPLAEITGIFETLAPSADEASGAIGETALSVEELAAIAENWNDMTLDDKQATVETMGKDDLEELMKLLGVDFENIPDEYTKNAYLNAYGADALEEILWVTGKWHDLTFEEKRVVLETQIENEEIKEALEARDLWNNEEFYSQLADIDMSSDDAYQQIIDLIDYWGELEGLEPIGIEVEAETKQATKELTNFQKNFGKITKGINKLGEGLFEFFEPAIDFFNDGLKIMTEAFVGYAKMFGQLIDGDWSGAWETFKDVINNNIEGTVRSLEKNVPKMWNNIKGMTSGVWEAFKDIDWGLVLTEVNSFFSNIANHITSIDWYAVGEAVSGSIADLGIAIEAYIDTTFGDGKLGKMITEAIKEMFTPDSNLNVEAGKFTRAVMGLLDGIADGISQAIGGFNITESAAAWRAKVTEFTTGLKKTWDALTNTNWAESFKMGTVLEDIKLAFSEGFADFEFDPITFEWPKFEWGDWGQRVEQLKNEFNTVIDTIKEAISTGDWSKALGMTEPIGVDVPVEPDVEIKEPKEVPDFGASMLELFDLSDPIPVKTPVRLIPEIAGGDGSGALTGSVGGGLGDSVLGGLTASIQASMASMQATVTAGMTGLNATITAGMSLVNSTITASMAQATMAMASGSLGAFAAGAAMGMGFYTGLASMRGAIVALASDIASSAASAMRSALKIASPSKVTTEIGRFTGMGLLKGLHAMVAPVDRASEELAMSAVPSLTTINPNLAMGLNRVAGGFNPSSGSQSSQVFDTAEMVGVLEEIRDKSQYMVANGRVFAELLKDDTDSLLAADGYLNVLMG